MRLMLRFIQLDMRRRFRGNHLSQAAAQSGKAAGEAGAGIVDVGPDSEDRI